MNRQELLEKYKNDVSETELIKNFVRFQKKILDKYGIKIEKEGRGNNTIYTEILVEYKHALTLFEEEDVQLMMQPDAINLQDWQFLVFIGIIATPLKVFRGNYKEFLKYLGLNGEKENIEKLKLALLALVERGFIMYVVDKTDTNYFVATLVRSAEIDMWVGIEMVRECRKINEKKWVSLFRLWLAILVAEKNQPFTNKTLADLTGMSEYQIRQNKKMLEDSHIFQTRKKYANSVTCIGQMVELNGFIQGNNTFLLDGIGKIDNIERLERLGIGDGKE